MVTGPGCVLPVVARASLDKRSRATVERLRRSLGSPWIDVRDCDRGAGCARASVPSSARSPSTMLQELDSRRDDAASVRLLWDDRTQIIWLHVQEDAGDEHVVGVPAAEAH